jgi:hypothetical protein
MLHVEYMSKIFGREATFGRIWMLSYDGAGTAVAVSASTFLFFFP